MNCYGYTNVQKLLITHLSDNCHLVKLKFVKLSVYKSGNINKVKNQISWTVYKSRNYQSANQLTFRWFINVDDYQSINNLYKAQSLT